MQRNYTNRRYLDALDQKVMVFDGAMGTNLQKMNLTPKEFGGEQYNGCNDYLVISCPDAVEKIHRSFLDVGVDVIETEYLPRQPPYPRGIWTGRAGDRDKYCRCISGAPAGG